MDNEKTESPLSPPRCMRGQWRKRPDSLKELSKRIECVETHVNTIHDGLRIADVRLLG